MSCGIASRVLRAGPSGKRKKVNSLSKSAQRQRRCGTFTNSTVAHAAVTVCRRSHFDSFRIFMRKLFRAETGSLFSRNSLRAASLPPSFLSSTAMSFISSAHQTNRSSIDGLTTSLCGKQSSGWPSAGCRTLHFGRTELGNEGLRRFKRGWGAIEEVIPYCRFYRLAPPRPAGKKASSLPNFVFRRMPLPINGLAGALIYPHLD